MTKWPYGDWASAGFEAWSLGIEASQVIGLRTMRMAAGGSAASDEAQRMVSEKLAAVLELQAAMMTGRLGSDPVAGTRKMVRHYRRKVKANRKRLA
jgi:hypothetical protein